MERIYVVALALFVIGALLFRNTSINELVGGTEYERRRKRRFVGTVLIAISVLGAGLAMLPQWMGYSPPEIIPKSPNESTSHQTSEDTPRTSRSNLISARLELDSH